MSNILPYNDSRSLESPGHFTSDRGATIEAIIGAWLHAKEQRSHSPKTLKAYEDTITDFRRFLLANGYDLLWKGEDFIPTLADHAQVYAGHRSGNSRHKGNVSPNTQNQRLAILSSFYLFAIKRRHLTSGNPIDSVERPSVQAYAQAQAIEHAEIENRLRQIDLSTLQGMRDIALLAFLLATGRRVSEVASLRKKHLQLSGKHITVTFERTKGGEVRRDTLAIAVSKLLLLWITTFYNAPFKDIPGDSPLWVNVHHESHYGEQLGYHGIAGVCLHYLGTSKVHTTRHSFAIVMEVAGAKLTDIQRQLGHKNAATTGIYMNKLHEDKNPHAEKVAALLGLEHEDD